jgi:hypothetical protein
MNIKPLKPNLVDPIMTQKIVKTLKPPTEDYWGPTKNLAQNFYQRFIKPNIYLLLFILLIIIILLFRYRSIKLERENREYMEAMYPRQVQSQVSPYTPSYLANSAPPYLPNGNFSNSLAHGNIFNLPDTDMAMLLYEQQKELLREPKSKRNSKYKVDEEGNISSPKKKDRGFAYPVYPNFPGGTLSSSSSSRKRS